MGTEIIAGIDIGGTKTSVLIHSSGRPVVDTTLPTDAWRVREVQADARSLAGLVTRLCAEKDLPAAALGATAVGAHGCDTDEQCREYQRALGQHLPGVVQVFNDSELMAPAAGYVGGIGVVAGTGSIAVARSARGEMLVAGGWGWILGDEGSAPALVREAAKAVRGALDNGHRNDGLIDSLMAEIGTADPTMLGRLLNDTRSAVIWGRYANAVFRAADGGSPLAETVIAEGGKALAALVGILIRRGADASNVVAGGGVIVEQPRLMQAFRSGMAEISPASNVVLLRAPPVTGALVLAERALQ
ncbi:BadF/BadG/BcrA/BcrD ATPase family protein [Labrys okinawensis]|uniref:BadF/BadG/BcrA/BcrD ATPase family protein n=1 Tax=Labrys okinawensis TaxID=346911 RepID=UPI0039BCF1C9